MLDALFWIAVFVSIVCGTLIIGIELYEEWAEDASNAGDVTGRSLPISSDA